MEKLRGLFSNLINRPELIFLIYGFVFGVLFMFLTPPFKVPDEHAHFHRAIETANGVFYNRVPPKMSEYDKIVQRLPEFRVRVDIYTHKFHQVSGYSSIMYLASALGVKVGALFKNAYLMFYLSRFFNLLMWLVLIYLAIKITPVFKWQFLLFALLPMSVFEGMSVSADSFVNSFAFLFFAYMFKLMYDKKEKLNKWEICIYTIMSIVSSLLKGCLIYPAFLLLLIKDKRKYIISGLVILLSVIIGGLWASHNYVMIGPNADVALQKEILQTAPVSVLMKIFKTIVLSSFYWAKGAIGILGWLDIRFPLSIYTITLIIYSMSFLLIPAEYKVRKSYRILSLGLIFMFLIIICTALFCTWNPVNNPKIGGFQGRYLISVFPLFFMSFGQNVGAFVNYGRVKAFYLIYVFVVLTYTCTILEDVYHFS